MRRIARFVSESNSIAFESRMLRNPCCRRQALATAALGTQNTLLANLSRWNGSSRCGIADRNRAASAFSSSIPASRITRQSLFELSAEDLSNLCLACSQTPKSGLKSPRPSCTMDSRSTICPSEHCSRSSPNRAPIQMVRNRSSGSWDVASLLCCSNRSRTGISSGGRCSKAQSPHKYTNRTRESTRKRPSFFEKNPSSKVVDSGFASVYFR